MSGDWPDYVPDPLPGCPDQDVDGADAGQPTDLTPDDLYDHLAPWADDADPIDLDPGDGGFAYDDSVDPRDAESSASVSRGVGDVEYADGSPSPLTTDPDPSPGPESAEPPAEQWRQVIGVGAVDPSGEQHQFFAGLESAQLVPATFGESEPEWLLSCDVDTHDWAQPSLLDGVALPAMSDADGLVVGDAAGWSVSVESLWERLSPGQVMPMTDSGVPDVPAVLDELAARADGTPLREVVDAVRQLVDK